MDPMMNAAMSGIQAGQQQVGSITPNAAQPQGAPNPNAILCGSLKMVVDQLMKYASILNSQGATGTQLANDLYKSAYQVNTVCEKIEKEANEPGQ